VEKASLGTWTALPGDAVKSFSGTAEYNIRFAMQRLTCSAWAMYRKQQRYG